MIVDTSAVISILRQEDDAAQFAAALESSVVRIAAPTLLETAMVAGAGRDTDLDELLRRASLEVIAFNRAMTSLAVTAHRTYGRGSGSAAKLNFGDCFSYALAKAYDEPLLFKGDDFTHTDIRSALA